LNVEQLSAGSDRREAMWRSVIIAAALLAQPSYASDRREALAELLTTTRWSAFMEFTQAGMPSDRASRFSWEFFRRGAEVVGRTLNLAGGLNCEFEVRVRDSGIDVSRGARGCAVQGDTGLLSLEHDPNDARFPFKHHATPQRWWAGPAEPARN
jgi:hypothetical protein